MLIESASKLKLNATRQLLTCAGGVNLLGEKMHTIRTNTDDISLG
jgi:hypothetical protein